MSRPDQASVSHSHMIELENRILAIEAHLSIPAHQPHQTARSLHRLSETFTQESPNPAQLIAARLSNLEAIIQHFKLARDDEYFGKTQCILQLQDLRIQDLEVTLQRHHDLFHSFSTFTNNIVTEFESIANRSFALEVGKREELVKSFNMWTKLRRLEVLIEQLRVVLEAEMVERGVRNSAGQQNRESGDGSDVSGEYVLAPQFAA